MPGIDYSPRQHLPLAHPAVLAVGNVSGRVGGRRPLTPRQRRALRIATGTWSPNERGDALPIPWSQRRGDQRRSGRRGRADD